MAYGYRDDETALIRATSIGGCNILAFDGERYAQKVAFCATELHKIDPDLAFHYLNAMERLTLTISNNDASYVVNNNKNPLE